MRYNSIERKGITKVTNVFDEMEWIFREQPIADVGIDAIVEVVNDGFPEGSLIALQIKSGKGNFHACANGDYTYYMTHVHKYYWLNYDLPVILCGYIPEKKAIYWRYISMENIQATPTNWKIELLKESVLIENSKEELLQIIKKFKRKYHSTIPAKNDHSEFDIELGFHYLEDAIDSIESLSYVFEIFEKRILSFTSDLSDYTAQMHSEKSALMDTVARVVEILVIRLNNELKILTPSFVNGFYLCEKYTNLEGRNAPLAELVEQKQAVFNFSEGIGIARGSFKELISMAKSFTSLPNTLGTSFNKLIDISEQYIKEFRVIKDMMNSLSQTVDKVISELSD